MSPQWTFHAYKMSHDGSRNLIYKRNGVVVREGRRSREYDLPGLDRAARRNFLWGPESEQIAFWAPVQTAEDRGRVALMDTRRLPSPGSDERPYEIIYDAADHETERMRLVPYGLEWAPDGEALFVLSRLHDQSGSGGSLLQRLEVGSWEASTVLRYQAQSIDFFMPPVSRFQNGSGPSSRPYQIVFGMSSGLYLTDPEGEEVRRVSTVPAVGLHNVEWSPAADKLALFFRRAAMGTDGRSYRGVWLVHLDREADATEGEEVQLEELYGGTNVHTMWFSPRGKYVCWATNEAFSYRTVEGGDLHDVVMETEAGDFLDIKGAYWHDAERWIAITAGDRLFIHDARERETRSVLRFGDGGEGFTAEPVWVGDEVFLTYFEDLTGQSEGLELRSGGDD